MNILQVFHVKFRRRLLKLQSQILTTKLTPLRLYSFYFDETKILYHTLSLLQQISNQTKIIN